MGRQLFFNVSDNGKLQSSPLYDAGARRGIDFYSLRSRITAYADKQGKLNAIHAGGNHIKKFTVQV